MGYGASLEGDIDSVTLFTGNITARNNTLETKLISLCAAIIIPAFYFAFTDSKVPCSTTLARYALCHTITAVPGGRVIGAPVHKIIWYTEPRITIFWNEIYNHNEANNGQKKYILTLYQYLCTCMDTIAFGLAKIRVAPGGTLWPKIKVNQIAWYCAMSYPRGCSLWPCTFWGLHSSDFVGLRYWIVYLIFLYFDICNYICLDTSYIFWLYLLK